MKLTRRSAVAAPIVLGLGATRTRAGPTADAPRAAVASGVLEGVREGEVVWFKGIPYAAPPVGPLRWRPPQPATAWKGVRPAGVFGAICPQSGAMDGPALKGQPQSEDCLYLNVWRPARGSGRAHPVIVWIHGGGFIGGAGSDAVFDGMDLARQGLVVVTFNYRLGRFGFFAHPALSAERPHELKANYGLMDQIAALKWVRANISAFGGDPGNVTIMGQSAGGASVDRHLISPLARGLFHRAISMSGNGREYCPRLDRQNRDGLPPATEAGRAFAGTLGATGTAEALRAISPEQILAAGDRQAVEGGPVIDGRLLTMDVEAAFARGLEARVPLILGSTSLELPIAPAAFEAVFSRVGRLSPAERTRIEAAYPSAEAFRLQGVSDLIFGEPAHHLAGLHAQNGQPTWLYRFSVLSEAAPPRLKGAPHAQDRPYIFGTLSRLPWPTAVRDRVRCAEVQGYWKSFAATGAPLAPAGSPAWPRYQVAADVLMDFTNDGPRPGPTPDHDRFAVISAVHAARGSAPAG